MEYLGKIFQLEELAYMLQQEFELISTLNIQHIFKKLLDNAIMVLIVSVVCKVDLDIK